MGIVLAAQNPPEDQHDEDAQQDEDAGQQVADAEQLGLCGRSRLLRGGRRPGGQTPGQLLGILPLREGAEELLDGLDALHRLEAEAQIQRLRDVGRHSRGDGTGLGVGVGDEALGRRDGAYPADHPVEHRRKAVFVGVAALELRRGILLRGRVALVQLLVEAAARRPQAHRRIARQPGAAIVQNADVGRADAPVHKPHLMHGLHPPEHRLEHRAGLLRRHSAVLFEPLLKRTAAGVLHDGVDRVVLFKDVQHRLEAVGRGDALDEAVEVGKVHPGGLEQHLAAGLRAEDAVLSPLCGQRQGHILLDGHAERPGVLDAPVEDALAVHALDVPHRIPARQHRARGETARRVAPCKLPAAVGALCSPLFQLLHTVWTNALSLHVGPSPSSCFLFIIA